MKFLRLSIALCGLSFLLASLAAPAVRAIEPGFIPLLDHDHTDGWEWGQAGGMPMNNGVWNTHATKRRGINHYAKQKFADFVLRFEYKSDQPISNSGVFLRHELTDSVLAYEIQVYGANGPDKPTGTLYNVISPGNAEIRLPNSVPQKPTGKWNEMEITAVGQKYTIRLNGKLVNEFTGNRDLVGYVGFQSHGAGPVDFRNIRIKNLGSTTVSSAVSNLTSVATDPTASATETLTKQAPNAIEWALAPLDQAVPGDIRQNLTFLREDLLDEGKDKPKASPEAYQLGAQICKSLLEVLEERNQTLTRAGFRAVEANARTGVTSEALEARRNYKMSWPQFAREESQRAELRDQATSKAEVMKELPKKQWVERTATLRKTLDAHYAKFREALRQTPAGK